MRIVPALLLVLFASACGNDREPADDAGPTDGSVDGGDVLRPPELTSITPTSGHPGDTFTLNGRRFATTGATVRFGSAVASTFTVSPDGLSIAGLVPDPGEGDPDKVTITVENPDNLATSLPSAFTYLPAVLVQWCKLLAPTTASVMAGEDTVAFSAQVYQPEVTPGAGAGAGLTAQVGFGPETAAPSTWTWSAANFLRDEANDDVFAGKLTPPAAGSYRYSLRISRDGHSWRVCDDDGADNGFDVTHAGLLTVTPRPTIAGLTPSSAKIGDSVIVVGSGFASGMTVEFGTHAATDVVIDGTKTNATVHVPAGAGTVDVSVTIGAVKVTKANAFTYILLPGQPAVTSFTPAFLPIAGGTIVVNGLNFSTNATVLVGGVEAVVTARSDTQLTATVPALAPGEAVVRVSRGSLTSEAADKLVIVPRVTITPDGDLSDWPVQARVATDATASDWGDANVLRELYVGYDSTNFYVGLKGRAEAANAIAGYLSFDDGTFGTTSPAQLSDNESALDSMLSSSLTVTASPFKSQFGFGLFGTVPSLENGVAEGMGLRRLENGGDFAWSRATMKRCNAAATCPDDSPNVEFAFPWRPAGTTDATDSFVAFPSAGTTARLFVRLVASSGTIVSNQALPTDPNQGTANNATVTKVVSVPIR